MLLQETAQNRTENKSVWDGILRLLKLHRSSQFLTCTHLLNMKYSFDESVEPILLSY